MLCKNLMNLNRADLEKDFLYHMLDLFKFLTCPSNILIKTIEGKEQTCGDFCNYMEVLASAILEDKTLYQPETFTTVR